MVHVAVGRKFLGSVSGNVLPNFCRFHPILVPGARLLLAAAVDPQRVRRSHRL